MYQRPMVMVYQEYDSTSVSTPTAALPPCIVGPCYHIIDPVEDEILALFGEGYSREGIDSGIFPNNAPGALIDRESVKFRFKNAMIAMAENCRLVTYAAKGNFITLQNPETCIHLLGVGDYVNFSTGESYRIIGINTESGTVLLNRTAPARIDTNIVTVSFLRKVEDFILDDPESGKVLLDTASERFTLTGITMEIDGLEYPVVSSELYVGYRALRQDCSDTQVNYGKQYLVDAYKNKLRLGAVARRGKIPMLEFGTHALQGPFLSMQISESSDSEDTIVVVFVMLITAIQVVGDGKPLLFDYVHGIESDNPEDFIGNPYGLTVETGKETTDPQIKSEPAGAESRQTKPQQSKPLVGPLKPPYLSD